MMNCEPSNHRYETMKYNRCGRSGLLLPAISLGLWHNFGGVDSESNCRAIIRRAFDLGITHFDLANNYGPPPGSAEEMFGKILKSDMASHRDELIVSTKAGYLMWPGPYGDWSSKKYLVASLDQSLKRLGIDYVDIFYSHRPDPHTPFEETMAALELIVRQGKALYVGLSRYSGDQTREAIRILKELKVHCLIHQPCYNMLDRKIETDLMPFLGEVGIGCIAFCPLAQGILTDKYLNGIPTDSRAGKPTGLLKSDQITQAKIAKVNQLRNIAVKRGQSLAQMSLAWVLREVGITSALMGVSKVEQMEENIAALNNIAFTREELTAIDAITLQ